MRAFASLLILITLSISTTTVLGQSPTPPNCLQEQTFDDFDFWVGDWNVTDQSSGQHAGTNSISKIENNCALEERWTNSAGATGRSINFYNPNTEEWRQVWVSSGAYSIDIVGNLVDGAMHLEGTIHYYSNNQSFPFRGTWTPNTDGSVRQFFEQHDPTTGAWSVWFDGLYIRQ